MKKYILVAIVFFSSVSFSFAQVQTPVYVSPAGLISGAQTLFCPPAATSYTVKTYKGLFPDTSGFRTNSTASGGLPCQSQFADGVFSIEVSSAGGGDGNYWIYNLDSGYFFVANRSSGVWIGTSQLLPGFSSMASTSGFFLSSASDTLALLNDRCSESSNIFSRGICTAFAFLFVPSDTSVQGFFSLSTQLQAKFPFAYFYDLADIFNTASVTGDTGQFSSVSLNFHALGLGSTTAMGNILPDWQAFSSSTVGTYISPSVLSVFRALMAATLWLSLAFMMFFEAKYLLHR